MKIPAVLKRHWLALVMALVVGALSAAPSVLAVRALGGSYQGIPFLYLDDEDIYLARIHEIVDGHPMLGSVFLAEYKDARPFLYPFGEFFYALPMLAGINPDVVVPVTKFVFPALLFLLVYAMTRRLVSEPNHVDGRVTTIAAGLLVTLGYGFTNVAYVIRYLLGSVQGMDLSLWTRLVNPIIGALLLFASLLLVKNALEMKRMRWFITAGALSGVMLYNYYFSWMIGSAVLLSLFILYAALKDWKMVKHLFVAGVADLVVASPYLFGALQSMSLGDGSAVSAKNGIAFTHTPVLNKVVLASLAFFIALTFLEWLKTRKLKGIASRPWWIFCASLLLGSVIAFNQQVITGRDLWSHHFVQYSIPFCMIVCLVAIHEVVRPRIRWAWGVVAAVGIVAPLAFGLRVATSSAAVLPDFRGRQADAPLFAWLETNEPVDCVVLVNEQGERLNRIIPSYTHCNTYATTWVFSGIPQERVLHDYFVYLRLNGVTADSVRAHFEAHPEEVRGYFFDDWETLFGRERDAWLIAKEVELATEYTEFLKGDLAAQIRMYRVDVLVSETPLSEDERTLIGIVEEFGKVGNVYVYGF
ncbi:MAG: hypothetical protein V1745_00825 [Patescibacteria group bacterium]